MLHLILLSLPDFTFWAQVAKGAELTLAASISFVPEVIAWSAVTQRMSLHHF
jgi:hypothetical protein